MIETECLFLIKPTSCTNFTNLFWHETLHFSDSSSVHHQEFIHRTLSSGIRHTGLEQLSSRTRMSHPGPARKLFYKPVWHIPLLSVQWMNSWWWTEELSEKC